MPCRVDPDRSGLDALGNPVRLREVARPDGGRQTVDRVVRRRDRLVDVVDLDHGGDRAEDLLLRDPHVVADAGEDRRLHEVTVAEVGRRARRR